MRSFICSFPHIQSPFYGAGIFLQACWHPQWPKLTIHQDVCGQDLQNINWACTGQFPGELFFLCWFVGNRGCQLDFLSAIKIPWVSPVLAFHSWHTGLSQAHRLICRGLVQIPLLGRGLSDYLNFQPRFHGCNPQPTQAKMQYFLQSLSFWLSTELL